jgi:DNA modification methylase
MTGSVAVKPAWRNRIVGHGEKPPKQLLANPANWRGHPKEQRVALAGALAEVGWVAQVLVNRTTGHVVDGHLRVELAIDRGEQVVPVTYVELTEDEERLVLASLDPLAAMATAEKDALAVLLAGLETEDVALARMLAQLAEQHGIRRPLVGDPDEVPPLPDEAEIYVKPGDLWFLGDHRLLCGDSTKAENVERLMEGEKAEAMWTDPPYGVEYEGKTRKRLTLARDTPWESDAVSTGAFRIAPLAPLARFYIAAPSGPRHIAFHQAAIDAGWRLHQELVWVKGTIVLGHSDYQYAHEPILYGYVPGDGRPGRGAHRGTRWYGDNTQSSVLEYPKPTASRDHPTSKPIALVAQCLRNSTAPGDLVYEPFAGGGSTLVAAETLGRRCYAIEIDPKYAQVTVERWQAVTGGEAKRVDG